jgi:hypothetical protein
MLKRPMSSDSSLSRASTSSSGYANFTDLFYFFYGLSGMGLSLTVIGKFGLAFCSSYF